MKINTDRLSAILFLFSLCLIFFGYGVIVGVYEVFPHSLLYQAKRALDGTTARPLFYADVSHEQTEPVFARNDSGNGLHLVTAVVSDERLAAKIIDTQGNTVHEWHVDWFDIWGDDVTHLPASRIPKSRPGTHIHGAVVLPDGDLVFNFENLGLVRLSKDSKVVWRLPYPTHHAIHLSEDESLWVCGLKYHEKPAPAYPSHVPPFTEYTILKISLAGDILREISVFDLLTKNDLRGYMHLSTIKNRSIDVEGDTLHLNDVEVFPSHLEPGCFNAGDVMISLRNINTILVFDPATLHVKWICTGPFIRQHDPDFLDGNTISVFDNHYTGDETRSRIVKISAHDRSTETVFEGTKSMPFYTDIMGKHQWLPNGHLLVTESMKGRAFELDTDGNLVWQYINYIAPSKVGIVEEVTRLPDSYEQIFTTAHSN